MNKALSIFNQLRPLSIGFDNLFDHFEHMFDNDLSVPNYPPYNILKTGDTTYNIEIALAGYGKKDVSVNYGNGLLVIKSIQKEKKEGEDVLHQGISKRFFSKSFTIAEDVEVKGAELKDGLLKVSLEKILPEGKKPRTIEIK
jgi:molecular chaperone IbpA